MDRSPLVTVLLCLISLLVGVGIGVALTGGSDHHSHHDQKMFRSGQGTGLTNPLLECDIASDTIGSRKEDFTPALTSFVGALKDKKKVSNLSVYYRDLNNGPVTNVDANDTFAPASLLKLPIALSYYSAEESTPGIMATEYYMDQKHVAGEQHFMPQESIAVGKQYSVRSLVESMIRYSDNNAMALLYDHMPIAKLQELYTLLGVDPTVITDQNVELTVRQYSIFFRILFNASFLSRTHSEELLKLLTETTFDDGLRAGVPAKITVAHKFGERKFDSGLQQLHDCGIVYYPKHPYLLCIMTRGTDTHVLAETIAETSQFVYQKIDSQYGKQH